MRKIREVLRQKHQGLKHRVIAVALRLSAGTVSEYVRRAHEAGVSWPLPEELDDAGLEERLYPAPSTIALHEPPDFAYIHRELRRKHVTLQLLWHEYAESHLDNGYGYSRFCELYRRWSKKLDVSMRQVHRAGDKVFVDYAGHKPRVRDRKTGESYEVELFVAVLGASSFVYAEATRDQGLDSWLGSHVRLVESLGGSPHAFVPDCLKSAVTRADRYEPVVNRSYDDLAQHYGGVVLPARPHHPKDKSKAEQGVLLVERWILAALRNRIFFSLAELNAAIRERLVQINERPMRQLGASRRELFEQLDRPALKPLPSQRFEMRHWKGCRVRPDYHVELDGNFYSVPYTLAGELVEVRSTATTVEVFHGSVRVTSHARLYGRGDASTRPEHMNKSHRAIAKWTSSSLLEWSRATGPATALVVETLLRERPHPEHGVRSCVGIIALSAKFGFERLEVACRHAAQLRSFRFQTVRNILVHGQDRTPLDDEPTSTLPEHGNVRGAGYYEGSEDATC